MAVRIVLLACLPRLCCSCSSVRVTTAGGIGVIGRTNELGGLGGERRLNAFGEGSPDPTPPYTVTVHPRGEMYSRSPCKDAETFVVKRGFVGADLQLWSDLDNVSIDGINEDGLTVSGQTLRQSVYQDEVELPKPSRATVRVCYMSLVPWALASFRTVDELKRALMHNVSVIANTVVPAPRGIRLHWAAEDATGDSVVIEYLDGILNWHENKVGVMTNDPDYTWHLRNLNNYVTVGGGEPNTGAIAIKTDEAGTVPSTVGHGLNLVGLPGDVSPASRFVHLFYLRQIAVSNRGPPPTLASGLKIVMGVLNDVWITKGTVALVEPGDGKSGFEFTQFSLVKVPKQRMFYWRTYDNSQWRAINLTRLSFQNSTSTPMDDGSNGILDVTRTFITAARENTVLV